MLELDEPSWLYTPVRSSPKTLKPHSQKQTLPCPRMKSQPNLGLCVNMGGDDKTCSALGAWKAAGGTGGGGCGRGGGGGGEGAEGRGGEEWGGFLGSGLVWGWGWGDLGLGFRVWGEGERGDGEVILVPF